MPVPLGMFAGALAMFFVSLSEAQRSDSITRRAQVA